MINVKFITGVFLFLYTIVSDIYSQSENHIGVLMAKEGAMFGVRIGYIDSVGKYVSGVPPFENKVHGDVIVRKQHILEHVENTFYGAVSKVGLHATDESYSEIQTKAICLQWSRDSDSTIIGKVTALRDVSIAVEAYGPYNYPRDYDSWGDQLVEPYDNPAKFLTESPTILTAYSSKVITSPGINKPTGGLMKNEGKSKKIVDEKRK